MRIVYFPAGPWSQASSRLRVHRVVPELERMGHEIGFEAAVSPRWDIAVFQKHGHLAELMRRWRDVGATVVWDCDDLILLPEIESLADIVTTDTDGHAKHYKLARAIPDCLDWEPGDVWRTRHFDRLQRVVWFGHWENTYHAKYVSEACRRLDVHFSMITDWTRAPAAARAMADEHIQWNERTVNQEIIRHDVAACSYIPDSEWVRTKGRNRLYKAWALGMPVIGTPIADYVDGGLFWRATTTDEWAEALKWMDSKEVRVRDAERGRDLALKHRAPSIARLWETLFRELMHGRCHRLADADEAGYVRINRSEGAAP